MASSEEERSALIRQAEERARSERDSRNPELAEAAANFQRQEQEARAAARGPKLSHEATAPLSPPTSALAGPLATAPFQPGPAPPPPLEPAGPPRPPLEDRIKKGLGIAHPVLRQLFGESRPEPAPEGASPAVSPKPTGAPDEEGAAAPARESLFLPAPGAPGGGRIIPGGMMPNKRGFETTEGIPVPPAALANFDEAAAAGIAGQKGIAEAEKAYGVSAIDVARQKMQAEDLAALEHQKVQADRAAYTQGALARINDFNNAANAKIDTNKGWRDKGALGSFFGLISLFLGGFASTLTKTPNTAAEMFENVTNREIKAQEHDIANAQHRAGAEQTLLGLHMGEFKDRDMAVDATKKGIYEKMLAMLEAERARKGVNEADPQYLLAKQALLNHVAEQQNKLGIQVAGKRVLTGEDKMVAPTAVGGAPSAKGMEPTDVVTIPPFGGHGEGKMVTLENKAMAGDIHKFASGVQRLHVINGKAVALLDKLDKSGFSPTKDYETMMKLQDLAGDKGSLRSIELGQGVQKDAEYWRDLAHNVGFYSANPAKLAFMLGSKDERARIKRFLRGQDQNSYEQLTAAVQTAGGSQVVHAYMPNPENPRVRKKIQIETGHQFLPDPIPAEKEEIP